MSQYLAKKVRIRYITTAAICWFIQMSFLQITIATEQEKTYPELPLEEMRIAAYTKEFAERFGFPAPAPGTEPSGGLQAIEFAIEKGRFAPYYFGHFKIYIDQKLPIHYPEEGVAGEKYMLIKKTHFFGSTQDQWLKWLERDRLHFNGRQGSYNRKAFFATMNYIPNKQGAINSLFYMEYHKDLLPGIAYIKLDLMGIPKEQKDSNVGIWLKRKNNTDYRKRVHIELNDFIKLELPQSFLQQVREKMTHLKKTNNK